MKTFLPTLFALIGVAAIAGILIAVSKIIESHYDHKVKCGSMREEDANKRKASDKRTVIIIAVVILALAFIGQVNYGAIENARKESYEEGYEKGYTNGYSDGHDDAEAGW